MCAGDEKYGGSLTAMGMRTLDLTSRTMSSTALHLGAADREIDRDRVDVELDCRGAACSRRVRVSIQPSEVVPFRLAITGMSSASDARRSVSRCPDTPPS
jgi:hypothetical protein